MNVFLSILVCTFHKISRTSRISFCSLVEMQVKYFIKFSFKNPINLIWFSVFKWNVWADASLKSRFWCFQYAEQLSIWWNLMMKKRNLTCGNLTNGFEMNVLTSLELCWIWTSSWLLCYQNSQVQSACCIPGSARQSQNNSIKLSRGFKALCTPFVLANVPGTVGSF